MESKFCVFRIDKNDEKCERWGLLEEVFFWKCRSFVQMNDVSFGKLEV